ncbi:MAG: hypothetical protein JSU65_09525, partial [Candidatus Zixiibacteriota bacterium]
MVKKPDPMMRAARVFLKNGTVGRVDPSDLAAACDRLVREETQKSLPRALNMAKQFVAQARRHKEMPLQTALRSLGWASHSSGKYAQAEKAYLEARRLSVRDPSIRAKIDRILIDTYMYKGDLTEARRRAQSAIRTFTRIGEADEVAKTRINYGNLFHRQDRHRDARKQYDLARRHLEGKGSRGLVLGLAYYNLANTLVQLLEFKQASEYYRRAKERFGTLGYHLYVIECEYGLSWLYMLEGEYHLALRGLTQCERSYLKAGQRKGVMLCRLDRAEAYLGLNLFSDAYDTAREAERLAKRLRLTYEMSKAAFFRARAAHACGRDRDAQKALTRARAGFAREKNSGFEAAAKLFAAQLRNGVTIDHRTYRSVRRLFKQAQLPLWEAICDLHYLANRPNDRHAMKRLAANKAVKSVPHLLAGWQTHLGDGQYLQGNVEGAVRHWARAANVLDTVRAKLPPLEMRAAFVRGRTDPYERLVTSDTGTDPERAAMWADRFKTAGIWAASGESFTAMQQRGRAEQSLAELSQQVSVLSGQLSSISGKRSGAALGSHPALHRYHKQVRDSLLALEHKSLRTGRWTEQLKRDVRTYSGRMPIVQFHVGKEDLTAFIHFMGETRAHRYRGGRSKIQEMIGLWQILLSRILIDGSYRTASDQEDESKLFGALGEYLWSPLEIEKRRRHVLIIPDGALSNLPWPALSHDGEQLIDRHSF